MAVRSLLLHNEASAETGYFLHILVKLLCLLIVHLIERTLYIFLLDLELLEEFVRDDLVDNPDHFLLVQLFEPVFEWVELLQELDVVLENGVELLLGGVLLLEGHRLLQLPLHVFDYHLPLFVALRGEPVEHLFVPHVLGDVEPCQDAVQTNVLQFFDLGLVLQDQLALFSGVLRGALH